MFRLDFEKIWADDIVSSILGSNELTQQKSTKAIFQQKNLQMLYYQIPEHSLQKRRD
jgi:hypothetical protein